MADDIVIRNTAPGDFNGITEMCLEVYPESAPWIEKQLVSHLEVFPEGQFVAVEKDTKHVVGMAASLIVLWDDYDPDQNWRDFTENGMFTNHDPENGRTLYAAEVMVRPSHQGKGIGSMLYEARRELVERSVLLRIRAGARLRGYHKYADKMEAEEYTIKIIKGEIHDPTLTFQLKRGFHVVKVVSGYLRNDPESLGFAAVIEWINHEVAKPEDYEGRNYRFST